MGTLRASGYVIFRERQTAAAKDIKDINDVLFVTSDRSEYLASEIMAVWTFRLLINAPFKS